MEKTAFSHIKRRYFEVFGDLEAEIRFLRKAAFLLLALLFFMAVFLFLLAKRPPVVIRVSEVKGAEAILSLSQNNAPTEPEMIGFAKRFTVRYTAYNSYTISKDMAEAMNQMTSRFQRENERKFIESGILAKITEAKIDTEIEFKEAKLERNANDTALVSVVGVRSIVQYGRSDFNQKVVFRSELVLRKVPRTLDVPEGLLVEGYREILINEISERKP